MTLTNERNRHIISGGVGLILLVALIAIGIKASFGAFDGGYELRGTFAAAGQGLLAGSDVKIRGVDVGEVDAIRLVENRALITLRMHDDTEVPVDAQAVIRPKTLFGEKFVDILPGEHELTGPYLSDGDEIEHTLGGFELEQVLTDAYPVLDAIDPAELAVVLDELATAGRGLGEHINRSIVNGATLAELGASNDAEFRQFTSDLALLSEELEAVAPDLVAGAEHFNAALPTLNERSDQLDAALFDTARLAGDIADLLEANAAFTTRALTDGSRSLDVLHERRGQIQPLLLGVTRYTRTLAEAVRFEVGDGSMMAAVKAVVSAQGLAEGHETPPRDDDPPTPVEDVLDQLPDVPDTGIGPLDGLLGGGGSDDDSGNGDGSDDDGSGVDDLLGLLGGGEGR